MVVRRSDARRRRLVVDPSQAVVPADSDNAAPKRKRKTESVPANDLQAYSYGADRRNHHKTTDLVPKRIVSYLLVVLAMLAALGLVNYCAISASNWEARIGTEGVRSLAIHGQGSIASWFSSFLLIMTGLASLQIYALRQHRCDDYQGTYRLWLWMAALFLIASVNCIVNLGELFVFLFQSLTKQSLTNGPWLLIGIKITVLAMLVARGIFEVRESRGSIAWVALVWIGYSAAALMQLPAAQESVADLGPDMVVGNCILIATSALFMAHMTYARFIFLQAHGLIRIAEKKEKKKRVKSKSKKLWATQSQEEAEQSADADSKSKPKKTKAKAKTKRPAKTAKVAADTKEEAAPVSKAKSKRAAKKSADTALAGPEAEKPELKISGGLGGGKKSAQDVLKEMAAASRAKQASAPEDVSEDAYEEDEDEQEGVLKMSKAQRRKLRKSQRSNKRAA